jgi:hypothetical protein
MKKNKTFKRFLAFLLCATMIITYMPTSVYTLADDGNDDDSLYRHHDSAVPYLA